MRIFQPVLQSTYLLQLHRGNRHHPIFSNFHSLFQIKTMCRMKSIDLMEELFLVLRKKIPSKICKSIQDCHPHRISDSLKLLLNKKLQIQKDIQDDQQHLSSFSIVMQEGLRLCLFQALPRLLLFNFPK